MDEEKVFAAWKEGRAPQPPRGRRVKNGLILLAVLSAALLAMLLLPVLFSRWISSMRIRWARSARATRARRSSRCSASRIPIPPVRCSNTAGRTFGASPPRRTSSTTARAFRSSTCTDWLLRRWDLPYIAIEMDSFGKVVGVLLDTDCPKAGVAKNKTLRECRLLTDTVEPFAETDLWYAAEYTDGSYYMGIARASYPQRRFRHDQAGRVGRPLRQPLRGGSFYRFAVGQLRRRGGLVHHARVRAAHPLGCGSAGFPSQRFRSQRHRIRRFRLCGRNRSRKSVERLLFAARSFFAEWLAHHREQRLCRLHVAGEHTPAGLAGEHLRLGIQPLFCAAGGRTARFPAGDRPRCL